MGLVVITEDGERTALENGTGRMNEDNAVWGVSKSTGERVEFAGDEIKELEPTAAY